MASAHCPISSADFDSSKQDMHHTNFSRKLLTMVDDWLDIEDFSTGSGPRVLNVTGMAAL